MPEAADRSPSQYVYRRIHPFHWDARKSRLKRGAFIPKANTRLSVFRADLQSPRGLLQHCLDDWQRKHAAADEAVRQSAEENLRRYGATPEELFQASWRIARLPASAFTDRGFTLDGPEPDGHQNVEGDYALYSAEIVAIAEILTEEETLA